MRCATPLRLELDQRDVFMAETLVAHPFRVDLLHGINILFLIYNNGIWVPRPHWAPF